MVGVGSIFHLPATQVGRGAGGARTEGGREGGSRLEGRAAS